MACVTIWANSMAVRAGESQPLLLRTSTQAWIRRIAWKEEEEEEGEGEDEGGEEVETAVRINIPPRMSELHSLSRMLSPTISGPPCQWISSQSKLLTRVSAFSDFCTSVHRYMYIPS